MIPLTFGVKQLVMVGGASLPSSLFSKIPLISLLAQTTRNSVPPS
jgi:hypothetical protein